MSVQFSGGEPTHVALLPRRRPLRPQGRLQQRAGRDQRHRVRQEPGVRQGGRRGRSALRLPAVRRHRQRRQLAPPGRQPVRRQAARHREPARAPASTSSRSSRSSTASTTSRSAASSSSRSTTRRRSTSSRSSRCRFTGRDEEVTAERRAAQRYTLSHLAHDVKNQTGLGEPARDWFPISFMRTFTDWADLVHGPDSEWGQLTCGCHPNCGVGMARDDRQGNQGSGAGHRVPERRAAGQGRRAGQRRRPRQVACRSSAWRWRCCATTIRSRRRRTSS